PWWNAAAQLLGLVAVDQISKVWVIWRFEATDASPVRRLVVRADRLSIILARNRASGAWGLLQQESEAVRRDAFLAMSIAWAAGAVLAAQSIQAHKRLLRAGVLTFAAGAIGNSIDRALHGFVTDFIDVQLTDRLHWPTF